MEKERQLILVVAFFLFMPLGLFGQPGDARIKAPLSNRIIDFSLFNYDNIISDYFESVEQPYINQLTLLIHRGTGVPTHDVKDLILLQPISADDTPPLYMMRLNQRLKSTTGYYFIDD